MKRRRFDQFTQIFLVNASQMAYIEEAPGTQDMLQKFIELFRYFHRPEETVSLTEEMNALQNYIDLQRLSYGSRFDVSWTSCEGLADTSVSRLTILDLFDNILSNALIQYENPIRFIFEVIPGENASVAVTLKTDTETEVFNRPLIEEAGLDGKIDDR
jgi:LytS/YehU family sensor histidine kinase